MTPPTTLNFVNEHMKKDILQKIVDYGLLATLVIFPLSINIALISPNDPEHPLIAINFSLADMFIGILLMLWGVKVIVFKEWGLLKFPPSPIMVFVGVVLISFVNATSVSEWAKESVQMIEYFILFYILLLNNFNSVKRQTIFYTIYTSTSILIVLTFVQHSVLGSDAYLVRGLFENRNFLGAYLCMTVPLIFSEFLGSNKKIIKIWMALLLLLTIWALVSGSAIIALVISLGAISWQFGKKIFIRYAIFTLVIITIYPFVFPEKNVKAINDFLSIYEQGSISENYNRRLTMLGDKGKKTLYRQNIGENFLTITTEQYFETSLPGPQQGERYKDMEDKRHIKNRYLEMQASVNLISEHTLLGVGAGNFQQHIGTYYNELPKVNTSEPGQHNGYLIVASTIGILGLAVLIWLFFSMLSGYKKMNMNRSLRAGIYGAVLALMLENMFVYILSSSLLVPYLYIIYLSLAQETTDENN